MNETCEWCGGHIEEDENIGENGECQDCLDANAYQKQREGDYRSMVL